MSDLAEKLRSLSPEQRSLFYKTLLRKKLEATSHFPSLEGMGPFRLAPAQERLWFLHQLAPASPAYNIPVAIRLNGELHVEQLRWALAEVLQRHEVLRSRFPEEDGVAVQRVGDGADFTLPLQNLSLTQSEAEARTTADRIIEEDAQTPFDIVRGPVLRVRLLRIAAREHVLLLNLHHIVADGASMDILVREVSTLYSGGLLPPLPCRFSEFAAAARNDPATLDDVGFWQTTLGEDPFPRMLLPGDVSSPAPSVGLEALELGPDLASRVDAFCRAGRVTPFAALLSVFAVLMMRHGHTRRIVTGTPFHGRNRSELEPLIGCFVNTLPLVVEAEADITFVDLAHRVMGHVLDAQSHARIPFDELVRAVQPDRTGGPHPLQLMFSVERDKLGAASLLGLTIEPLPAHARAAKFDLFFLVEQGSDSLRAVLEYDASKTDRRVACALLKRFRLLLADALDRPEALVGDLNLLTSADRGFLQERHGVAAAYPRNSNLVAEFDRIAATTPRHIALREGERQWSYGELQRWSSAMSAAVRSAGARPSDTIALDARRSAPTIAAMLGVLRAGCSYLFIDPDHPPALKTFLRADSNVITVEGLDTVPVPSTADIARSPADVTDTAALFHTSGSTGQPKGVQLSHRAILRLIFGNDALPFGADTVIAQSCSLSFDASTLEIWGSLLHGGTCVIYPDKVPEPAALRAFIAKYGVTLMNLPTAVLHALADAGADAFAGLRCLVTGGERLSAAAVARIMQAVPGLTIINGYGPTECTTFATMHVMNSAPAEPVPIGRAIANTTVRVLDRFGSTAPPGAVGEIHVAGDGLATSYAGRAALTAAAFLPDAFSETRGTRTYRTGDLGRWSASGDLYFLGRADRQLKVRGVRIEPAEIETVLAMHPGVAGSSVLSRRGITGAPELVAFFSPTATPPSPNELAAFAAARLPASHVPARFIMLTSLPRLASGKPDLRGLLELPIAPDCPTSDASQNLSEDELVVAQIWRELLGCDAAPDANFFSLGGHSLLAIRLAGLLRERTGASLPLHTIFEAPTLREFSLRVRDARIQPAQAATPLPPASRSSAPQTSSQRRLWFLHKLEPESAAYNVSAGLRLQGALDVERLEESLSWLVDRHASLRSRFFADGKMPVQEALPPRAMSLIPIDVREEDVVETIAALAVRPFDLEAGEVFRAHLLRSSEQDHVLLLGAHHIACDGWSNNLLFAELIDHYAGRSSRPRPLQMTDFALWEAARQQMQGSAAALSHWQSHLRGMPAVLDLPTDYPRPAHGSGRGERCSAVIEGEALQALQVMRREVGVTLFMALAAGLALCLYRYTGQQDFGIGFPEAGRSDSMWEHTVGLFARTLVLRVKPYGAMTVRQLLEEVRHTCTEDLKHPDVALDDLLDALGTPRDTSRAPLFQVMLAVLEAAATPETMGDVCIFPSTIRGGGARFDLTLTAAVTAERMMLELEYATDLFRPATAERLLQHIVRCLSAMAANAGASLADIELMMHEELHQQLADGKGMSFAYPAGLSVCGLIEQQVNATPHAIALRQGQETLDYAAFWARSGAIAAALAQLEPESLVGIAMPRSFGMVAAVTGTLRAGTAFVPLDTSLPDAVLSWRLKEARLAAIITSDALYARIAAIAPGTRIVLATVLQDADRLVSSAMPPAQSLAYVIFTSGSTGAPKGVMLTHQALLIHLLWMARDFRLTSDDIVVQNSYFGFDICVWELLGPFLSGASLLLPSPDCRDDPMALVREQKATVLRLTPTALRQILCRDARPLPPSLRMIISNGEALPVDLQALWFERDARPLHDLYGPTETCITSLYRSLHDANDVCDAGIGKPIDNTLAYVLDGDGNLVPPGVAGELYLGGETLARGYLQQPALTASRFVPDPFSHVPGSRMYRTGDLVRRLPDGCVQYLHRIDRQAKISGFRVGLPGIESVLRSHPAVRDAAVIVRTVSGDSRLLAYLALEQAGDSLHEADVRAWLDSRLPAYEIPTRFIVLHNLPRLANDKLDTKALEALPIAASESGAAFRSEEQGEDAMCALWAEVLGIDSVAPHANFFDLGGNSLISIQLMRRVEALFRVDLPLRTLFQSPTPVALAQRVRTAHAEMTGRPVFAVSAGRASSPGKLLPLSWAQQTLWEVTEGEQAITISGALRLCGAVDTIALAQSVEALGRRHDALRTRIVVRQGIVAQTVDSDALLTLHVHEAEGSSRQQNVRHALRGIHEERSASSSATVRVDLWRIAAEESWLVFTLPHILCDGLSLSVLAFELGVLYAASLGASKSLPRVDIQMADFALAQRSPENLAVFAAQLAVWRDRLKPPLETLPLERVADKLPGSSFGRWPMSLRERLLLSARVHAVTPLMAVLSIFHFALQKTFGVRTPRIGMLTGGRGFRGSEHAVGLFVNTVLVQPLSLADAPWSDRLASTRDAVLDAVAVQDVPFELVAEMAATEHGFERGDLFQPLLIMDTEIEHPLSFAGTTASTLRLRALRPKGGSSEIPIILNVLVRTSEVRLHLAYNAAIVSSLQAAALLRYLRSACENLPIVAGHQQADDEREEWHSVSVERAAGCVSNV